jgi:hypothetical protein
MKNLLFAILALCAIVLAACSPASTDTPAPADTAAETPAATEETTTPAAAAKPEAPVQQADAKADFMNAFAGRAEYTAQYNLVTMAGGRETTGTMTQYTRARGENDFSFRIDMTVMGVETRSYMVPQEVTTCTRMQGAWNCFASQNKEMQSTQQEGQEVADSATSIVRDGTKQVAGTVADCYKATTEDGYARYCLKDNVPLYVGTYETDGTMISELTATSYSTRVSDSDFTPPAKAQDMGAMMGGQLPPGMTLPSY